MMKITAKAMIIKSNIHQVKVILISSISMFFA